MRFFGENIMSKKNNNVELVIDEALDNIRKDRALASTLLIELMKVLKNDDRQQKCWKKIAASSAENVLKKCKSEEKKVYDV